MRHAGRLTALAVREAIRSTEPGIIEGQLAAIADYVFQLNGASGGGYRPIIACGDNIWNMHYYRNNCPLMAGELVLMDYAPDCWCYTSDIGRMWPVSGQYEPWQRELYGFVVDYHMTLLELIAPGKTCAEICRQAEARLMPIVERTRWTAAVVCRRRHGHCCNRKSNLRTPSAWPCTTAVNTKTSRCGRDWSSPWTRSFGFPTSGFTFVWKTPLS